MNITEIRMRKNLTDSNIKAFASITIDDSLVVHDIKIIEGKNGLFISMPSKKVGERYIDISHPVTAHSRSVLVDSLLEEYQRQLA
ncbi:MAG: transcriptional regulator [Firmicutes bacterium HGW-Firmicutes-14]|nr:MAG: transcriptional regulator [Firmicutes bacterium HGW-Firmicutes-14]